MAEERKKKVSFMLPKAEVASFFRKLGEDLQAGGVGEVGLDLDGCCKLSVSMKNKGEAYRVRLKVKLPRPEDAPLARISGLEDLVEPESEPEESGPESELEFGTEFGPEGAAEPEAGPEPGTKGVTASGPELRQKRRPESGLELGPESERENSPESRSKRRPEPGLESRPEFKPESGLKPGPEDASAAELGPEGAARAEMESGPEPRLEGAAAPDREASPGEAKNRTAAPAPGAPGAGAEARTTGQGLASDAGEAAAKPRYKSLKKRMGRSFKSVAASLAGGQAPAMADLEAFVADSRLMCSYPGLGDKFYPAYLELVGRLAALVGQGDADSLREALSTVWELNQMKKDCHARHK